MRISRWSVVRTLFIILVGLAQGVVCFAQQTSVSGVVTDESKSVVPGVTITATSASTGRQFIDTTSEKGEYRLEGLPAGLYNVTADLPGFAPTLLKDLDLLVGQNA